MAQVLPSQAESPAALSLHAIQLRRHCRLFVRSPRLSPICSQSVLALRHLARVRQYRLFSPCYASFYVPRITPTLNPPQWNLPPRKLTYRPTTATVTCLCLPDV